MTKQKIFAMILAVVFSATANAGLIMTGIYDGSGSTPKGIELYVECAGDFGGWEINTEFNSNTSFSNAYTFPSDGSATYAAGEFIYITSTSEDDCFTGLSNVIDVGSLNMNGDDRVQLTDGSNVIDQYGVSGTDGTGEPWEYVDSYAFRVNGTTASGGFVIGDWNIADLNSLDPGNGPLSAVKGTFEPVPEPSTLALLFLGIVPFLRRRK